MKLLTQEIRTTFKKIGSQENVENPIVVCKFFTSGSQTRYATEFNEETEVFFGLIYGNYKERGYFTLKELQDYRCKFGLPIERDLYFSSCKSNELPRFQ